MPNYPKFGDVYEWRPGGQLVMVISDNPLAFVHLRSKFNRPGEVIRGRVPFSEGAKSWVLKASNG